MKTILIFPPSWHPSQPYLSLPSLTAFLKQQGVLDVIQRDLNIEFLETLLTWEKVKGTYERMEYILRSGICDIRFSPHAIEKYNIKGHVSFTNLHCPHRK